MCVTTSIERGVRPCIRAVSRPVVRADLGSSTLDSRVCVSGVCLVCVWCDGFMCVCVSGVGCAMTHEHVKLWAGTRSIPAIVEVSLFHLF